MSDLTTGQLRELLKDSPDDAEISVGATIEYTKAKSATDLIWEVVGGTLFIIGMILVLVLIGICIDYKAETIRVVRDTIYVKQKYEVEVKGPDGYVNFFDDNHGFVLKLSDGTYRFKMQQTN